MANRVKPGRRGWLERYKRALGKKMHDDAMRRTTTTMIPANGGGDVPYGIVSAHGQYQRTAAVR